MVRKARLRSGWKVRFLQRSTATLALAPVVRASVDGPSLLALVTKIVQIVLTNWFVWVRLWSFRELDRK